MYKLHVHQLEYNIPRQLDYLKLKTVITVIPRQQKDDDAHSYHVKKIIVAPVATLPL